MEVQSRTVIVVIPIYQKLLSFSESASLANTVEKFSAYPIAFVRPEGLDITDLKNQYPQVQEIIVSSQWLGLQAGIAGYNKMMMSVEFYDLFKDYEYMLICHSDAWVFRDKLAYWCNKGYDHVAAPWPARPRYTRFPLKQYLQLRTFLKPHKTILRHQKLGHIGNGGFSLRRVSVFREGCIQYADIIQEMLYGEDPHAEDIFWALFPKGIHVPSAEDALNFAFDTKPELSYKLNGSKLPMACHGFNKADRIRFWKMFIPCLTLWVHDPKTLIIFLFISFHLLILSTLRHLA